MLRSKNISFVEKDCKLYLIASKVVKSVFLVRVYQGLELKDKGVTIGIGRNGVLYVSYLMK